MLPKWATRGFVRTGNEQSKICSPEDCRSGGIRRRLPKLRGQDSNLRFWHDPLSFLYSTSHYYLESSISNYAATGENGIRTHVPRRISGFQDRFVMTASIPLQIYMAHRITQNFPTELAYPDGRVPGPFSENPSESFLFLCVSDHEVVGRKPDLFLYRPANKTGQQPILDLNQ